MFGKFADTVVLAQQLEKGEDNGNNDNKEQQKEILLSENNEQNVTVQSKPMWEKTKSLNIKALPERKTDAEDIVSNALPENTDLVRLAKSLQSVKKATSVFKQRATSE